MNAALDDKLDTRTYNQACWLWTKGQTLLCCNPNHLYARTPAEVH